VRLLGRGSNSVTGLLESSLCVLAPLHTAANNAVVEQFRAEGDAERQNVDVIRGTRAGGRRRLRAGARR